MGRDNVTVVKCKSHVSKKARAGFDGAQEHVQAGNDRADEYAKLGAEADDGDWSVKQAVDEAAERVKGVLGYIAEFAERALQEGNGWADTDPPPPKGDREVPKRRGKRPCASPKPTGTAAVFGKIAARSPVSEQAKPHGHVLMLTGQWVWCVRCACHAAARPVGLLRRCRGAPSAAYRTVRRKLAAGYHPARPWGEWVGPACRLGALEWLRWSEGGALDRG